MDLQQVLPAEPTSAGVARRFAHDALKRWQYPYLIDVLTLLVSELVTNALLHAGSDIGLRIALRGGAVRVEVRDASPVVPSQRGYGEEAVTGRGLELVEMLSSRWGVDSQPVGKVVWFEVPTGAEAELMPAGVQDTAPAQGADPSPPHEPQAEVLVRLIAVPVALYRAMQQHNDALLREYTLMALGASPVGTASSPVAAVAALWGAAQAQLQDAADTGLPTTDVLLRVRPHVEQATADLQSALDEADRLSSDGALLTPAALPEIRACRRWMLGEVMAQLDGAAPTPWGATPRGGYDQPAREVTPQFGHDTILDQLNDAIVVGDEGNRIAHLNPAAERLLGWSRDQLVGRRLTTIIPEHLREAHVAGFTRYLVTRESRLLGNPVHVAARRGDGSEVPVELLLTAFRTPDGRQAFAGTLRDLSDRTRPEGEGLLAGALSALAELVPALTHTPTRLDHAAPRLLATLSRSFRCQFSAAWVPDPAGERIICMETWNDGQRDYAGLRAASSRQRFASGIGVPGRVWRTGEPAWIPDVVADANLPRAGAALEHGLRAVFAFPLQADGRTYAVLEFFTERLLEPDPDMLVATRALGAVIGPLL